VDINQLYNTNIFTTINYFVGKFKIQRKAEMYNQGRSQHPIHLLSPQGGFGI
jgi:hypothetical protein